MATSNPAKTVSEVFGLNKPDIDTSTLVILATIAENAERYNDMCIFTSKLVIDRCNKGKDLSIEERNQLSVAFKNIIGSKRASWRTLKGFDDDTDIDQTLLTKYRQVIELELKDKCQEILNILETHLIKSVQGKNNETEVFYLKMCMYFYNISSQYYLNI